MSRLCLDTSAYSQFLRGHQDAVAWIDKAEWIGMPVITLGELRTGFALGSKRVANEERLSKFLAHPLVKVLAADDASSRLYAEIVAELQRTGRPLPTNDLWIAASALREGATVLTFDAHFREIRQVGSVVLSP